MKRLAQKEPGGEGPKLRPALPGVKGQLNIRVECPYKIVDAWLDAEIVRQSDADSVSINALPCTNWQVPLWTAENTGRLKVQRLSLVEATTKRNAYTVHISLRAGEDVASVGLESLRITTVFMNNFQALPYLAPGRNRLPVNADANSDLSTNPLKVTYVWIENGTEKTLAKPVPSIPFETEVTVAGTGMPRMKSVTLAVE